MPRQRKSYRNKTAKRRYVSKRRSMRRKRGGGCGCESSGVVPVAANYEKGPSIFNGGGSGDWSPGLHELAGKNYYPLSDLNADPLYDGVASRQTANFIVKGGRQARRGKSKGRGKSMRRKRGGGSQVFGSVISGLNMAVPATVTGATSYSDNFFSDPYTRYTTSNSPLA